MSESASGISLPHPPAASAPSHLPRRPRTRLHLPLAHRPATSAAPPAIQGLRRRSRRSPLLLGRTPQARLRPRRPALRRLRQPPPGHRPHHEAQRHPPHPPARRPAHRPPRPRARASTARHRVRLGLSNAPPLHRCRSGLHRGPPRARSTRREVRTSCFPGARAPLSTSLRRHEAHRADQRTPQLRAPPTLDPPRRVPLSHISSKWQRPSAGAGPRCVRRAGASRRRTLDAIAQAAMPMARIVMGVRSEPAGLPVDDPQYLPVDARYEVFGSLRRGPSSARQAGGKARWPLGS